MLLSAGDYRLAQRWRMARTETLQRGFHATHQNTIGKDEHVERVGIFVRDAADRQDFLVALEWQTVAIGVEIELREASLQERLDLAQGGAGSEFRTGRRHDNEAADFGAGERRGGIDGGMMHVNCPIGALILFGAGRESVVVRQDIHNTKSPRLRERRGQI